MKNRFREVATVALAGVLTLSLGVSAAEARAEEDPPIESESTENPWPQPDGLAPIAPDSSDEMQPDLGVEAASDVAPNSKPLEGFATCTDVAVVDGACWIDSSSAAPEELARALATVNDHAEAMSAARGAQSSATPPSIVDVPEECIEEALNSETFSANYVRRFDSCWINDATAVVYENGAIVGEVTVVIVKYEYSAADSNVWISQLDVSPTVWWGKGVDVRFHLTPSCSGAACTRVDKFPASLKVPLNGHVTASAVWKWRSSAPKTSGYGGSLWQVRATQGAKVDIAPMAIPVNASVRCDNIVRGTGCVFPVATPYISYYTLAYPQFTAHLLQAWSSGNYKGNRATNIPIHRTQDAALIAANRSVACPPKRAGGPIRPAGFSCDEYPFASTREGAASWPTGGRTFPGCQYPGLPIGGYLEEGWSACMIPDGENKAAGAVLKSVLYDPYRVIDGDACFVDVTWPV